MLFSLSTDENTEAPKTRGLSMVTRLGRAEPRSERGVEIICAVEKCALSTSGPGPRDRRVKKTDTSLVLLELIFW